MDSDEELEQEAHEPPDEDQSPDVVETDPTGRYSRVSRLTPPTPPKPAHVPLSACLTSLWRALPAV